MARIKWLPSAREDLCEITRYYKRHSTDYAEFLTDRILDAVRLLRDFPKMGTQVPEYREESVRQLIIERYRIIYVVTRDSVEIMSVIHGSRLLK